MSRRRRRATLNTRLNDARTPVFVLDHRRQVVFFNAGCEHLTGWRAEAVLGRVCDYATEDAAETAAGEAEFPPAAEVDPETAQLAVLTGSLCPPPEVLAGRPQSVPAYLPHREGRALGRQVHFYPLTDAEGRVESVLGVITPLDQPRPQIEPTPAQQLHAELASLRLVLRQRFSLASIVAASEPMQRVLAQVNLARTALVFLALEGEPGTGKEHLARVIHYTGPGRSRAFVPLDCRRMAAIDLKLALRRLLGDESGGGGTVERSVLPGLQAGTIYLESVENLPRDLQEWIVTALASASPIPDLRLIVSTTADLDALLADETLRPDFYYLVTPLRIALPPLRRRPEDLAMLAQGLLESLNRGAEAQVGGMSEGVWTKFREYNWPGNLDELAAVIQEARAAAAEQAASLIGPDHLPFRFRTGLDAQSLGPRVESRNMPLEPYLEQIEREHILAALEQARFSKKKAADLLGMTRPRLYRRMESLGIEDRETAGEG